MIRYIGDTHGVDNLLKLLQESVEQSTSYIHVGDVGVGFYSWENVDKRDLLAIDALLEENQCKLYMIRGNHDNPAYFSTDNKTTEFNHIVFVEDYSILNIEDKTILFIGGAVSIDRSLRREGVDWWADEKLQQMPVGKFETLVSDRNIDVVVTHCTPSCAPPLIKPALGFNNDERHYLNDVVLPLVQPNVWYYGHYHYYNNEVIDGTNFICLAENMIK